MPITKPRLSTNINTDVGTFTDPILVLHQGSTAADVDVGFLMNRSNGLTSNAAVIWQESSKSFVHILTNSSGAADANLVVQSYANVSVGNVLLIANAGIYVDGTLGDPGQVLASDGSKTYWAPPGGFTGGTVANPSVFQSNLVISNTTASTSNVTGALVVLGGAGIGGNVYANAVYTSNGVYWSGNGEAFTSTTIANTAEITANLSSGQNVGLNLTATGVAAGNYGSATSIPTIVVDSKGRITSVTSNAVSTTITLAGTSGSGSVAGGGTLTLNGTANQLETSVSGSTITIAFTQDVTTPGNLTVTGNLVVQGNTVTLNTETLTVEDLNITLANGAINAAATDGAGLTVAVSDAQLLYKNSTDSWVFNKGVFASGNLVANSGTSSSSTTTGALVVSGGAGISGNVYIGTTADQTILLTSYPEWSANAVRQTPRWTTSTTTPVSSILGDMWYDSSTDILYEYISDGTNNIWVDVSSAFGNNFTTLSGVTVRATGNAQATSTTTGDLQVNGGVSITTGNLYIGGSGGRAIVATGNIVPSSNLSIQNNLGSDTLWWNNFYGVSTQARYADLAENYLADYNYTYGTVVCFGGTQEITISTVSHDSRVAGVISQNPAHLMNGALKGEFVLPLALQGRVYCSVRGPIGKGDLLVTSDAPGTACRLDKNKFEHGCLIGKSLDNINDDSIKLIEIVVGRD